MTIYEIDKQILECVDLETGEIIDEAKLNALQMAREQKIENIACWYKQKKAEAEAIKSEKLALAARQKVAENQEESLKRYLDYLCDGQEFVSGRVKISFRRSESVEVLDVKALESGGFDEYLKYEEPEPKKAEIKKAIKAGKVIPGCSLIESVNIQIK